MHHHLHDDAAALNQSAPEAASLKDEGPGARDTQAPTEQITADTSNCTGPEAKRKAFEDYRAKLALAGKFGLYELADSTFLVTMSGYSKSLPDLRAVAAFARQVGCSA
jgi:hypothetical protein